MAAINSGSKIQSEVYAIWSQIHKSLEGTSTDEKIAIITGILINQLPAEIDENLVRSIVNREVTDKETKEGIHNFASALWTKELRQLPIKDQIQIISDTICEKQTILNPNISKKDKSRISEIVTDFVTTQFAAEKLRQSNQDPKKTQSQIESDLKSQGLKPSKKTLQSALALSTKYKSFMTTGDQIFSNDRLGVGLSHALLARQFWAAQNDPRILQCRNTADLLGALQEYYPDLYQTITKYDAFIGFQKMNPNSETFVQCFQEAYSSSCLLDLTRNAEACAFMDEIAHTPPENLNFTNFYNYLSNHLESDQIDAILDSAAQQISLPQETPPETRRKYGMLVLAANYARFDKQVNRSQQIFKDIDDNAVLQARAYNSGFAGQQLPTAAKTFIMIGHRLSGYPLKENDRDPFSSQDFWHSQLFTPTQQQVLANRQQWVLDASIAFEEVIKSSVQANSSELPHNLNDEIKHHITEKEFLDLPQGRKQVPRQHFKDAHRYNQLRLGWTDSEGQVTSLEYPGAYILAQAARGDVYSRLHDMADGSEELHDCLLEVMCQNATKLVTENWLFQELSEKTGTPKVHGFLMLAPYNTSINIHKNNQNSITVSYDYNLGVTNQYKMEWAPDEIFTQNHSFRVEYQIKRENEKWHIHQPNRVVIADKLIDDLYQSIPAPRRQEFAMPEKPVEIQVGSDIEEGSEKLAGKMKEEAPSRSLHPTGEIEL